MAKKKYSSRVKGIQDLTKKGKNTRGTTKKHVENALAKERRARKRQGLQP